MQDGAILAARAAGRAFTVLVSNYGADEKAPQICLAAVRCLMLARVSAQYPSRAKSIEFSQASQRARAAIREVTLGNQLPSLADAASSARAAAAALADASSNAACVERAHAAITTYAPFKADEFFYSAVSEDVGLLEEATERASVTAMPLWGEARTHEPIREHFFRSWDRAKSETIGCDRDPSDGWIEWYDAWMHGRTIWDDLSFAARTRLETEIALLPDQTWSGGKTTLHSAIIDLRRSVKTRNSTKGRRESRELDQRAGGSLDEPRSRLRTSCTDELKRLAERLEFVAETLATLRINSASEIVGELRHLASEAIDITARAELSGSQVSEPQLRKTAFKAIPIIGKLAELLDSRRGAEVVVAGLVGAVVGLVGWPATAVYTATVAAFLGKKAFLEAINAGRKERKPKKDDQPRRDR